MNKSHSIDSKVSRTPGLQSIIDLVIRELDEGKRIGPDPDEFAGFDRPATA